MLVLVEDRKNRPVPENRPGIATGVACLCGSFIYFRNPGPCSNRPRVVVDPLRIPLASISRCPRTSVRMPAVILGLLLPRSRYMPWPVPNQQTVHPVHFVCCLRCTLQVGAIFGLLLPRSRYTPRVGVGLLRIPVDSISRCPRTSVRMPSVILGLLLPRSRYTPRVGVVLLRIPVASIIRCPATSAWAAGMLIISVVNTVVSNNRFFIVLPSIGLLIGGQSLCTARLLGNCYQGIQPDTKNENTCCKRKCVVLPTPPPSFSLPGGPVVWWDLRTHEQGFGGYSSRSALV